MQNGDYHKDTTRKQMSEVHRGVPLSSEHKAAISQALSGDKNPFYGKHHTEETKAKNRDAHLGKPLPEHVKEYLKEVHKGEGNPFFGRHHTPQTREKIRLARLGTRHTEETKEKMSEAQQGVKNHNYGMQMDEETKRRISEAKKGCKPTTLGRHHTEGAKEKLRQIHTGMTASEETKKKMSLRHVGNKSALGHRDTAEVRKIKSQATKEHWQNSAYREAVIKNSRAAANIRPNKPEGLVLSMFNEIAPNEWAFVGDGQLIIGGRNPDIANVNGHKKLCEIFGRYWHGQRARCFEETEEGRKALFAKYGYDTLVIWEDELKEPERVKEKVRQFCEVGHGHTHLCKA